MGRRAPNRILVRKIRLFLFALSFASFFAQPTSAQQATKVDPKPSLAGTSTFVHSDSTEEKRTAKDPLIIPPGTILPVRLNSTISSAKSKSGQAITARIMQDVPLSLGLKIRAGSKVIGHIVEAIPANAGTQARVSVQFDKLLSSGQTIAITTNLRAIAGFMRVLEAETPPIGPSESDVYQWLTRVQVGGDVVYGEGGLVTAADNSNLVVGKAVPGGVLSRVRAKEGSQCRGPIGGDDSPQALWVFSSDACGTYGFEDVLIAHAGRTAPTGLVVFASSRGNLKIPGGAGMLLRVNASGQN